MLPALAAAPAALRGDPVAGKEKAESERCLECHGASGPGQGNSNGSDGKLAKLGGQDREYIVKQIEDFRSGRRKHAFMAMMANSISDADVADISAYFAGEQKMASGAAPRNAVAQRLFQHGDPARQLAPCISCHGAHGQGAATAGPVIGGQGVRYLAEQMFNWRSGERSNSAGGVMNQLAKPLSDEEIEALAHYVSEM